MQPRDRIKEIRTVKGRDLLPNPKNWRTHPDEQTNALRGLLTEVGQVDILRAIETPAGLIILDGHLRADLTPDADWRVAVLDLSEAEANLVLATFDPVTAMAEADEAKLAQLLAEIETSSREVAELLQALAGEEDSEDKSTKVDLKPTFGVLIHVPDEPAQRELLRTADDAGFDASAIITGIADHKPREPAPIPPAEGVRVIERVTKIKRSVRVRQVEGMFDLPKKAKQSRRWELNLDLPATWQIGLIVGPSGSGKSTLAREWFGDALVTGWAWPEDAAIVDAFPEAMPIAEITALLSSVGFSSPPGWVKPYHVLSNGERFRVDLARALAERPDLAVLDEFTSVVDRTVAEVGSHAAQKAIRASGRRLVAVTCHYDVADWLQPDWVLDMLTGEIARRSLRRRPEVAVVIRRVEWNRWPAFREHHYLSHQHHKATTCFIAEVDGRPAAWCSVIHRMGKESHFATHRLVTLPDFQGIGLGHALHEFVAGMFVCRGKGYFLTSSHPAMIAHCARSAKWRYGSRSMSVPYLAYKGRWTPSSAGRMTTNFKYIGPALPAEALRLGVVDELAGDHVVGNIEQH